MDFRRHFINTVIQHVPDGQVHLYRMHASDGMVRAPDAVFDRGNEVLTSIVVQKQSERPVSPGSGERRVRRRLLRNQRCGQTFWIGNTER